MSPCTTYHHHFDNTASWDGIRLAAEALHITLADILIGFFGCCQANPSPSIYCARGLTSAKAVINQSWVANTMAAVSYMAVFELSLMELSFRVMFRLLGYHEVSGSDKELLAWHFTSPHGSWRTRSWDILNGCNNGKCFNVVGDKVNNLFLQSNIWNSPLVQIPNLRLSIILGGLHFGESTTVRSFTFPKKSHQGYSN